LGFYNSQLNYQEKENYEKALIMMGALSRLFSDSDAPYLVYRSTENIFCKYLTAENLSRADVTADAKKNNYGIGIKTWTGSNLQKIAEFNQLKSTYEGLNDKKMIEKIVEYRNDRIRATRTIYGINDMIYHCTIRTKNAIKIAECPLIPIMKDSIRNVHRKKNVITFSDGVSRYSFNISKSTLYKDFSDVTMVKKLNVDIIVDPYSFLKDAFRGLHILGDSAPGRICEPLFSVVDGVEDTCVAYLPLYSSNERKGKHVPLKNNLNIRFAAGRPRNLYEVGIPIPAKFRHKYPDFFPGRNISFNLVLPNGNILSAKQCQEEGKSLMSNPNSALGKWLIDDVLHMDPEQVITYDMLNRYGIDAIKITKVQPDNGETYYRLDFALTGSYEKFMGEDMIEED